MAPIVLALFIIAVIAVGLRSSRGADGDRSSAAEPPQQERSIWRCHACARIQGKNWTPCRTVTGRGTEKAARDLVKQRVCEEADDPSTGCRIVRLDCRELPGEVMGSRPAGKAGPSADR